MKTSGVIRKLTAVLHADVKGYSRLMAADEVSTVRTLAAYKEVLMKLVELHRGRVVDTAGDGFLVEFASVVDAVGCAVEFQREIKARNAKLPDERKMQFRIGINIGDVIQEGDQIFGDGVNIAARLEGLADPGGICVSGTAYDQLKKKLPLEYAYLGERTVKNIDEPVRVYGVRMEPKVSTVQETTDGKVEPRRWRIAAGVALAIVLLIVGAVAVRYFYRLESPPPGRVTADREPALALPDIPSIAVLPLVNTSGDKEQEYFSDGLTEELINSLGRLPKLFVIAPDSAFAFKGKPVDLQQVSKKLGVRYVVEGDAGKDGDRTRIAAKLTDTQTGHQLWGEHYERDWKDIFVVQDDIARNIMAALDVKIAPGETVPRKAQRPPTLNMAAYEKFLRGLSYARQHKEDSDVTARQSFEQAVALDSEYAAAYGEIARMHLLELAHETGRSTRESLDKAVQFAQKAVTLGDSLDVAHVAMCQSYLRKRQYDNAIASCERAVILNPNSADAYASLGQAQTFAGRADGAVGELKKAIRLNPVSPVWYFTTLGNAYMGMNRYDQAIESYNKGLDFQGDNAAILMGLTVAHSLAGRREEARVAAAALVRVNPKFSVDNAMKRLLYKNPADTARITEALRKTGLK